MTYTSRTFYSNKQFKIIQERVKKSKQENKQGFSDLECYDLHVTSAMWLKSRIKKSSIVINHQDLELNEIIWLLDEIIKENGFWPTKSEEFWNKLNNSSILFGKNLLHLSVDKKEAFNVAWNFAIWFLPRLKRHLILHKPIEDALLIKQDNSNSNEIIWMFEQIINKENLNSSRFKKAQEIFGEEFLGLWC